ncbi:MAG: amino acid permease [Alphaproteobacteria bacterium]|nr:amino acid permease [Alphaproteobacteria bacterium]
MTADSDVAIDTAGHEHELKRVLGPMSLVALGVGATIGAGIFVITGTAAAQYAGPAVLFSFVFAAFGCLFAGLCYAELAAMIPQSGSAYTYAYASFGRFAAWVIGWDLALEYGVAAGAVAVGWGGYFQAFMTNIGMPLPIPHALMNAPIGVDPHGGLMLTGALINLPAVAIVAFVSLLLILGVRESAGANTLLVAFKVLIIVMVVAFGLPLISAHNLTPFIPENQGKFGAFGWSGILRASGVIFFSYIGFDTVSVAAQETHNPQRDLPIGILGSLVICTVLYIFMALTMVGLAHYSTLNVPNPVTVAIRAGGWPLAWLEPWVNLGALIGTSTVILVSLYGQTRILYSMSRDGMLPRMFSRLAPRSKTPVYGTLVTFAFGAFLGGIFPIDILGELVSIGTLLAFVLVCVGVLVLRATKPNASRPFVTPFSPITPLLGIAFCGAMMYGLPGDTWIRLAVWFIVGLVIYATYGVWHAKKPVFEL